MTPQRPLDLVLRRATEGDVEQIAALERDVFGTDAWSVPAVAEELVARGRRAEVADIEGRLAGYSVASTAGEVVDLLRIAVAPQARRGGVASALLASVLHAARRDGARRVLLEVSTGNAAALAFYSARGFHEIDRRRRYYRDGCDALVLKAEVAGG